MTKPVALAKAIKELRDELDELWEQTEDTDEKLEIVEQMEALDVEVMRLISINIRKRGSEYLAATKGLEKGIAALKKAKRDLDRLVAAIEVVATAVELVSKIRPA